MWKYNPSKSVCPTFLNSPSFGVRFIRTEYTASGLYSDQKQVIPSLSRASNSKSEFILKDLHCLYDKLKRLFQKKFRNIKLPVVHLKPLKFCYLIE